MTIEPNQPDREPAATDGRSLDGRDSSGRSALRTVLVDLATAEVVTAFRAAGIRSVVLKGPSFAEWLYGAAGTRQYVDTDLLVANEDVPAAERVLEQLKFTSRLRDLPPGDRPGHARAWFRRDLIPCAVDLHHTLVGVASPASEAWQILAEHTQPAEVAGVPVEFLDEPARAMHVALHVAQGGPDLHQVTEDLKRALQIGSVETWRSAAALASHLQAREAMAAGLRRLPEGERMVSLLGLPTTAGVELRLRNADAPEGALGAAWLLQMRSPWGKVGWLARKIVPSPVFVRSWAGAVSGRPMGLGASYWFRWTWLARRGPAALAAARRARRAGA